MKKYVIFIFAALFMFSTTMSAKKDKKGKGPSVEVRVEKMTTDLGLNDTEKAAVKTLLEKQDAEKKQLFQDNDKKSAEFKPKMKELRKKQDDELKATLGVEKFQKLKALEPADKKSGKKSGKKSAE